MILDYPDLIVSFIRLRKNTPLLAAGSFINFNCHDFLQASFKIIPTIPIPSKHSLHRIATPQADLKKRPANKK